MAKYTLEDIMYGDKYGIESAVFLEALRMVQQDIKPKGIKKQLNMLYVKHTLLAAQDKFKKYLEYFKVPYKGEK